MPSESQQLEARFLTSITQLAGDEWNALTGTDYPFVRFEFLKALEDSGSTDAASGWQPCHATLYRGDELLAIMPLYLKSHSYGEYVFDWSWADAWRRHGLNYYPKLVTAIPFTPATGPRICTRAGEEHAPLVRAMLAAVQQFATEQEVSSWHVLFPQAEDAEVLAAAGMSTRLASQFHWFNRGYGNFDDFLAAFNSRKRKSLRRERRRVEEQGITLVRHQGAQITEEDWSRFYHFYQLTYAKRSGHGGYLTREFFQSIGETMPEQCLMISALQEGRAVAGSLCFQSADTLYGRYWGCEQELDCLHFEACYYQGIEHCIEQGLERFDPGAQGEHKIQRGFEPIVTRSSHWIADPGFAAAIEDFTQREYSHIENYIEQAAQYLPFKQTP